MGTIYISCTVDDIPVGVRRQRLAVSCAAYNAAQETDYSVSEYRRLVETEREADDAIRLDAAVAEDIAVSRELGYSADLADARTYQDALARLHEVQS